MDIRPVSNKRIYQSVVEQLINLIKDGKLKAGDQLPPERALTEMLCVSRSSLREALRAMEVIGLVEVRPGEGAFISDLSIQALMNTISPLFIDNDDLDKDLLEFRKAIELDAVRIVIENGSASAHKLLPWLEAMGAAIASSDVDAGAEADIEFHRTLLKITGNRMFILASDCVGSLLASSVRFNRERILKRNDYLTVLFDQHTQIYQSILDKDAEKACRVMREHLDLVKTISYN